MRQVIVVGNSHTLALKAAPQRDGIKIYKCVLEAKHLTERRADLTLDEAVRLVKDSPDCIVVSAIGGNQHQMYLLEHSEPFDFYEPGNDAILADHKVIPYRTIYDQFRRGIVQGRDGHYLSAVRGATTRAVYHLGVPPPKEDEAHIRRRVEGHFRERMKSSQPLTKASIRAKLWRVQRQVIWDFCESSKIEYVPVPASAIDVNDFLKPEYYAADATHANAAYGVLVLDQILALQRNASRPLTMSQEGAPHH
jgi:hypothetical protein